MLVVIALGGSALLRRGEPMTSENRRCGVRIAAQALAPIAAEHQLVVGHGNGRRGTQTEGKIGCMIEQELGNLLPFNRPFATLLTMVEVDPADPAFTRPTRFIGPVYDGDDADRLAAEKGWVFKPDGDKWRRVVPCPEPKRILEVRPIKWLLERNTIVIAAGVGIPTMYAPGRQRTLTEVECVIDKDLASELLARELGADLFVMVTDADAVYADWGNPTQTRIRRASPRALRAMVFAADSMGPKVEAACRFAAATGKTAAIGALPDLSRIIAGDAGTTVASSVADVIYA
jgi:carbamate kinase